MPEPSDSGERISRLETMFLKLTDNLEQIADSIAKSIEKVAGKRHRSEDTGSDHLDTNKDSGPQDKRRRVVEAEREAIQGSNADNSRKTTVEVATESGSSSPQSLHEDSPWQHLNWKFIVQSLVATDPNEVDDETLLELLVSRGVVDRTQITTLPTTTPPGEIATTSTYFTVLHVVKCCRTTNQQAIDTDPPFVSEGGHLVSKNRVRDGTKNIERKSDLAFLMYQDYHCCKPTGQTFTVSEEPELDAQRLYIFSCEFRDELNRFLKACADNSFYKSINAFEDIRSPQVWAYHCVNFRNLCASTPEDFDNTCAKLELSLQFQAFVKYFRDNKLQEFEAVDALLSKCLISSRYLEYIFIPDSLLVHAELPPLRPESTRISQLRQWPKYTYGFQNPPLERKPCLTIHLKTFWWEFNGNFYRQSFDYTIQLPLKGNSPLMISSFPRFPLYIAGSEFMTLIKGRGQAFWRYRSRSFIQYTGPDSAYLNQMAKHKARFMIDRATWKRMTAGQKELESSQPNQFQDQLKDDLGEAAMAADEPPNKNFVYLLPTTTIGFNIQDKKWTWLFASFMMEVEWDRDAFDKIVIEPNTRELMTALVTHQVSSVRTTDIIEGKGNGLIVLLHGGPGTGKTLTAESVAEYARKPLYRVSCGDIGTTPELVEEYLTVVLKLGRIWDCVVLLDEAEVFLQQRSLTDLARNALVAVFLRILEYYDGILILTSNRVGTFEEGFKSRIHLSIHYDKLARTLRKQIWQNFMDRLEDTEEAPVDLKNLLDHLDDLSRLELNGREIRNSIKLARQLAFSRKNALDYNCLKHVIDVANQFDKYLKKLNEDMDASVIAKELGLRNE